MSIDGWKDKENVEYVYNRILFSHDEEGNPIICDSLNGPWEHYAEWNKPDTKRHIVWFHLYEMSRISKSTETKGRLVVARGQAEESDCLIGTGFPLGVMKMFWK